MPKRRNAAAKRNPAASRSMKARTTRGTRRSPDRLAERSGLGRGVYSNRDYYNTATYSLADVSQGARRAIQPAYKPTARGGSGNYDDPTVPTRSMAGGRPRAAGGSNAVDARRRRRASTESALRRADASMFNYDD